VKLLLTAKAMFSEGIVFFPGREKTGNKIEKK